MPRPDDDTIAGYADTEDNAYCVPCWKGNSTEKEEATAAQIYWRELENQVCTMCGERLDGRA